MHLCALVSYVGVACVVAASSAGCRNSRPQGSEAAGIPNGSTPSGEQANGGTGASPGNANNSVVGQIGASGQHDSFVGRFDTAHAEAPRMSFLGSKIGAQFTGTSIAVSLSDTGNDYFNAVIDGAAPIIVATQPSVAPILYPISTTLAAGPHTIWLSKRTEPAQRDKLDANQITGTATFYGFSLSAAGTFLPPPAPKARLIEGLGDSGCSGYGVDQLVHDATDSCVYTGRTQNADASVFAAAAKVCQAEIVNLSASGKAVYNSYWDPNDLSNQLPTVYQQTVAPSVQPAWAFTGYVPDVVVVDAGGDDLFGAAGAGAFPDPAAFLAAYTQLLTTIRAHYANAFVVAAISAGATGQDKVKLTAAIQQAINARAAAGDTRVALFDYFAGNPNGWSSYGDAGATLLYGCEWHPSVAGSAFLGQQLGTFINSKMGW